MANFIEREKKVIEAITFNELIEYAKANGYSTEPGKPLTFQFKGHTITQDNDKCYMVEVVKESEGIMPFTPDDMLIVNKEEDQLIPYNKEKFNALYEIVD